MNRCLAFLCLLLGLVGGLSYYVGLLDRPPFVYHELGFIDGQQEVFAIMACTRTPDIGSHIGRMLQDTKGLLGGIPEAKTAMKNAVSLYGTPDDVDSMACGVYFDNPSVVAEPRWCIGWVVSAASFDDDVEKLRAAVDALYEGEEQIRKIRIGLHGPGLRARIPWRTMITPMFAPMIHWNRAHAYLAEGGYTAVSNEHGESVDSSVFSEIYVTSEDDHKYYYIDYIALLGDTTNVWEDSFPSASSSSSSSSSEDENPEDEESGKESMEVPESEL